MEEFTMENIFKTIKKQYLSDVEYVFDFASELLDKLNEKYPNAKLENSPFPSPNIRIMFVINEDTRMRIEYLPSRYSTGAPALAVSLEATYHREQAYSVYAKGISMNNRSESFQTITTIVMDRYEKVINIYDRNEKYAAFESDANVLIDLVKEIDAKLDAGGKEFKTIASTDRSEYDDYLD